MDRKAEAGCPVMHDSATAEGSESENPVDRLAAAQDQGRPHTNQDWWPNQLDLSVLHAHSPKGNPLGADFAYADAFAQLDVEALKGDIAQTLRSSQDWWPADFGHYGGLMIRMSWHSAGTYRVQDGRGGAGDGGQRFAPLNSWPDNANLDKARRLLWPVKQKYGQKISWADLLVLAGNVALEDMGFETFGFAFGREDVWEPEEIFWGPEDTWLGRRALRRRARASRSLGAVQMGLIYVNPEGPNGNPDPVASARDIRETFARMAMNDEETVALIAGGHTFGKTHGNGDPDLIGPEPEGAPLENQGLGWISSYGSGKGGDTITSGLEVTWTDVPTQWSNRYFEILFGYEWELTESPAGAKQWVAKTDDAIIPDARTTRVEEAPPDDADLRPRAALRPGVREDLAPLPGEPRPVRRRLRQGLVQAAAPRHGPGRPAPLGPWVPEAQLWQDPVPAVDHDLVDDADVAALKEKLLDSGLSVAQLVSLAWASAASFRRTDRRGGANGARIRLEPQRGWAANADLDLDAGLAALERVQRGVQRRAVGTQVSLADLIVLGGAAAIEKAARDAGHDVTVPFTPGRTDATQEQTDVDSMRVARAPRRRLPQLAAPRREAPAGEAAGRQGLPARPVRPADDRPGRRPARPRRQRRRHRPRCPHRPAGHADQRLLRQPAVPGHAVEGVAVGGGRLRDPRPRSGDRAVDRHGRRPGLRLQLPAPRAGRGLRQRGRRGEVRQRLRRRVDAGHGQRQVRPARADHRRVR